MSTRRQFLKRIAGLAAVVAVAPKELLEPIETVEPEVITTLRESTEYEWLLNDPIGIPYSKYTHLATW